MNIFVGCSSRDTDNRKYNELAIAIGAFIITGKHNYVFGGCEYGLMGKIYSIVSESPSSKVIVCMSDAYAHQLEGLKYDELNLFSTMAQRKEDLIKKADVILFIPGGIGTLDEMITAIETKRCGEHNKPIIIANVNGYFDSILQMIEKTFEEKFADSESRNLYQVAKTLDETLAFLRAATDL